MSIQLENRNLKSELFAFKRQAVSPIRSKSDSLALGIATVGGIGYIPIVPASWASLFAVAIYFLVEKVSANSAIWAENYGLSRIWFSSFQLSLALVFLLALFFVGVWAATRVEKLTGRKDPKIVVVDEVVGQFITFLFVPAEIGWWIFPVGFLLFRFFDIWKLYPANELESLSSGLGAMADDVMAGIYAAAAMSLLCVFYLAI